MVLAWLVVRFDRGTGEFEESCKESSLDIILVVVGGVLGPVFSIASLGLIIPCAFVTLLISFVLFLVFSFLCVVAGGSES